MSKNLLSLVCIVILCFGMMNAKASQEKETIDIDDNDITFEEFKEKFGKKYQNAEEVGIRKSNFIRNVQILKASDCQACGITAMFDLSDKEFQRLRGARFELPSDPSIVNVADQLQNVKGKTLRSEDTTSGQQSVEVPNVGAGNFDWRDSGRVTPVRDQGSCGSCWAFAADALFQSELIKTSVTTNTVNLAEQYLVSCTSGSSCNGGSSSTAASVLITTGSPAQTTYGYNLTYNYPGICSATPAYTFTGYQTKYYYNTSTKMSDLKIIQWVNVRPIIVYIAAKEWNMYTPLTSRTFKCSKAYSNTYKLDHAVLLVGYTDTQWVIKNSWGAGWGTSGYIYISRTSASNCGIGFYLQSFV